MFNLGALTFREFVTHEPVRLAHLQDAIVDFLQGRSDSVLFGIQAVNAYVTEKEMRAVVELESTRANELAEELSTFLSGKFQITVRVRQVAQGNGLCIYQIRNKGDRHLIDIRPVSEFSPTRRIAAVLVPTPEELVAQKVIAAHQHRGQPKSGTDWRDVAMLLLAFPELKNENSIVRERLQAANAGAEIMQLWRETVNQEFLATDQDSEFD